MNYSEVFGKAWKMLWKHKVLWVFALFAAPLLSLGGNASSASSVRGWNINRPPSEMPPFLRNLGDFLESIPATTWVVIGIAFFLLIVVISIIGLFAGTAGKAAMFKGVLKASDPETTTPLSFKTLWNEMKLVFWQLLLLRVIISLAGFILGAVLVFAGIIITIFTLGIALCCLIPLLVIAIPLGWLVNMLIEYASIALVDENLDVMKAIDKGWDVLVSNIGHSIAVYLILGLLNVTIGFLLAAMFLVAFIPLGISFAASSTAAVNNTGLALSAVIFLVLVLVTIPISVWLKTYRYAFFGLAYRQLKSNVKLPGIGSQAVAIAPVVSATDEYWPDVVPGTEAEADPPAEQPGDEPLPDAS